MIQIITQPNSISTVGNPVAFTLRGSDYMIPGVNSVFVLFLNGEFLAGNWFTLFFADQIHKFECVDNPPAGSATYFKPGTSRDGLFSLLSRNPDIADRYFISTTSFSGNNNAIHFIAKETSARFNAVLNTNASVGLQINTAGVDPIVRENYRILQQTFFKNKNSNEQIGINDFLIPGADACTGSDVSEYIKLYVHSEFQFPVSDAAIRRDSGLIRIFCRYSEFIDNVPNASQDTNEIYVLPGALSDLDFNILKKQGIDFSATIRNRFLSNHPQEKIIYKDQPEKLFFVFQEKGTFTLRCKLILKDKKTVSYTLSSINTSSLPYSSKWLYEFNVGADIVSNGHQNVASYEIWLQNSANKTISNVRHYILREDKPFYLRYYFFKNAFGVAECAAFYGTKESTLKYEREISQRYDDISSLAVIRYSEIETISISTGLLQSRDMYHWLREFQRSDSIFEIIDDILFQCVLVNTDTLPLQDNDYLYAHKMEYRYAFSDLTKYNQMRRHTDQFTQQFD